MLKSFVIMAGMSLLMALNASAAHGESGDRNGQIRDHDGEPLAWSAENEQWLSPLDFWKAYAESQGGITWGTTSEYPEYNKVKEFDTILIEVKGGYCLMEFFHNRWRRANDVRRWDPKFNDYAGCPHVFD